MTRSRLGAVVVVVALPVLAACGSGDSSSKRVVVAATGRIGSLKVDESDKPDVISFAGRPDSERRGRYDEEPQFDALGYDCGNHAATSSDGDPGCKTVFYLDSRSGKLELLFTTDARFVDVHGVHVGTPTAEAERLLRRRAFAGCYDGFRLETRTGFLVAWLQGGRDIERRGTLHVLGGRVAFLVVHSRRRNPGILDCVDS